MRTMLAVFVLLAASYSLAQPPAAAPPADKPEAPKPIVETGPFVKVYDPNIGEKKGEDWYINDHGFTYGPDGQWHLYGITGFIAPKRGIRPQEERVFAHATAKTLLQQPWEKRPPILKYAPEAPWHELHLWAPYVVRKNGTYYMFYCAGNPDHTKYQINLATSTDCNKWTRHPANPMVVDGFDARDPFITRIGDKWVMYYTATTKHTGGNHCVAYVTSDDLIHWKDRGIAFVDPTKGTYGGPCESPQVVQRGDRYYLMLGPRNGDRIEYVGTDVYASRDPFHWKIEDRVAHLKSHAPEVLRDVDGKWYISDCGWGRHGVYIAPLIWNDGLVDPETNIDVPKAK
jgi:arabinan endo-1,5-alpha-L-arabinosidase